MPCFLENFVSSFGLKFAYRFVLSRDIRANSILLDDKYEVRIGSLGDARIQDSETHSSILSRMFGFSR